jgi:gamma-glutamylcyclotransferase (GGCT)/AIG2-like uncharacterized protein YtfP
MAKAERRLYIAYGSNLNLRQMAYRCPTAKVVGAAVMRNWHLLFCGAATIERFKGGKVPVLVWDIQPKDEKELDVYEGWPRLYRKESVRVTLNGKQVRAMVYIMNSSSQSPPNSAYYNVIREGYKSAGFDENILREAAEKSHGKGGSTMDSTVKEQILKIRKMPNCPNMLSINEVQRIAYDMEFYELVNFIEEDRKAYVRFIFAGEEE